jgi:UDP-3-O-[3-hydroxymyristoyl] glucosamine N-acyltransferase
MKNIAIFGFKDSFTGQLINMLDSKYKKRLSCIISSNKIIKINIKNEKKKRPNKKTEFITKKKIFNLPVYDEKDFIKILKKKKIKFVFIMEDKGILRRNVFQKIKDTNIKILSYIHKSAKLMGINDIGEGTIIFPDCYIGYKTDIGKGCIIQSGSRIEHHSTVGNFCDINPNLTTGGFAKIGDFCEINISVDIINKIKIGDHVRLGAGSLILKDVPSNHLQFGRPSKFIRFNANLNL